MGVVAVVVVVVALRLGEVDHRVKHLRMKEVV